MKYLILKPDEDGDCINWELTADIGRIMDDYGIDHWLTAAEIVGTPDPRDWEDGAAAILEVKVLEPKPKETVVRWEV